VVRLDITIARGLVKSGIVGRTEQVKNKKGTKMDSIRLRTIVTLTAAAITVGIGSEAMATYYAEQFKQPRMGGLRTRTCSPKPAPRTSSQPAETLETIYTRRLPALKATVEQAIRHLEAGHQKAALEELAKTQDAIASLEKAIDRHVKPRFANTHCPIMGSPIDAENVAKELTRTYKGQTIAFCCAGCPAAWDRLSQAEKEAKFKAASKPQDEEATHGLHKGRDDGFQV